jgi:hypothetical protein
MYTLKSIAQRGTALGAAVAVLVAAVLPAVPAYADSLNPLTDRSLTLSSSAPGWSYTDGSGNTTYAPPNSGANGQKTGNTFDFKVSSDSTTTKVKTITLQYCTQSAGQCTSPGDNLNHATGDTVSTADLNVVTSSPTELSASDFSTVVDATSSDGAIKAVPGYSNPLNPADTTGVYAAKDITSNFTVYYLSGGTWQRSSGWTMTAINVEDGAGPTGKNNYIILANSTGLGIPAQTEVKVVFFGMTNNYITNPGSGAFFVKINTYKVAYDGTSVTTNDLAPTSSANIIDGGVTVANVMNQSIQITTKVLETMQFSVGTVDPNTLSSDSTSAASELDNAYGAAQGLKKHTPCEPILKALTPSDPVNVLKLGNQGAESSLEVDHTYSTHSYWRLSSNSSAGATVYYSGHTLSNTVGDFIDPVGATKASPTRGAEQFGLALDNGVDEDGGTPGVQSPNFFVSYDQEATYENANDNGKTSIDTVGLTADGVISNASWHTPKLAPLAPTANYDGGTGTIDSSTPTTQFAFDPTSDTIPVPIATEQTQVVDCVTGKMRYMANIAATTPAGIYTTKINYIAAPQY